MKVHSVGKKINEQIFNEHNKELKAWYYYWYGKECKTRVEKIGEVNTYANEDVSSIIEQMQNNDYFDPY